MNSILQEEILPEKRYVNPGLKWPAVFFSYIFHPFLIPIYTICFLVYVHPSYFSGFSERAKLQTVIISTLNLVFYPFISILLLKALGFISSVFMYTKKDRIIPYMACGIFFFWAYTVFKKQEMYPPVMADYTLGLFLAFSAALLANIYFKVSMHAIGMAGCVGLFWVIAKGDTMLMTWPLALAILSTGIVCTSRMILSHHSQKEIYAGLAIGFVSQIVAAFV